MCLRTPNFTFNLKELKNKFELTAKTDIVVYKVLKPVYFFHCKKTRLVSIIKNFTYQKGKLYKSPLEIVCIVGYGICSLEIHKGLHAFVSLRAAKTIRFGDRIVVKMIIPKGSKYYLGNKKDIVSNQLIWK